MQTAANHTPVAAEEGLASNWQRRAAEYSKLARWHVSVLTRNGGVDALSRAKAIVNQNNAEWAARQAREWLDRAAIAKAEAR